MQLSLKERHIRDEEMKKARKKEELNDIKLQIKEIRSNQAKIV
jgi:hypothetical protein